MEDLHRSHPTWAKYHIHHLSVTSKSLAITNHFWLVLTLLHLVKPPNDDSGTHPVGILAVTSTFPYLILAFPLVLILALMTGLMIVPKVELETAPH